VCVSLYPTHSMSGCLGWHACPGVTLIGCCIARVYMLLSAIRARGGAWSCWGVSATYCNILQHTATYCNMRHLAAAHLSSSLQHTATYCNILGCSLQYTTTYCNTLGCWIARACKLLATVRACGGAVSCWNVCATYCNILQNTAPYCNTPQRLTAPHCNILQRTELLYCESIHVAVHYKGTWRRVELLRVVAMCRSMLH